MHWSILLIFFPAAFDYLFVWNFYKTRFYEANDGYFILNKVHIITCFYNKHIKYMLNGIF